MSVSKLLRQTKASVMRIRISLNCKVFYPCRIGVGGSDKGRRAIGRVEEKRAEEFDISPPWQEARTRVADVRAVIGDSKIDPAAICQ
jgi:hypothetical protein